MGLDQYLSGRKFLQGYRMPQLRTEDGFEIEQIEVKLGYWRKHPNLHGFIVENYGPKDSEGSAVDNCQDIDLDVAAIHAIIKAITEDQLPYTEGFFFGQSFAPGDEEYERQKEEDIELFSHAVAWMTSFEDEMCWRSVVYRASW